MTDIYAIDTDMRIMETDIPKGTNILSIQLGSLEYQQDFGIDLDYFLNEKIKFQNESFKAYLTQRLAAYGVTVASLEDVAHNLYRDYIFNLAPVENDTGFMAR